MTRKLFHALCSLGAFALILTGCQSTQDAQDTSEAPVEEAQSESPEQISEPNPPSQDPTDDVEELSNCSSAQYVGIIVSGWDRVTASKGAPDHRNWIESLGDEVDDHVQTNSAESPCTGALCVRVERYQSLRASQPVHIGRESGIQRKCRMLLSPM